MMRDLAGEALILQCFAFVWGAVWGSFLNVVIYRLPHGMSLSYPPSRCSTCLTRIRWYDNIPVISYLILRGRCRACKSGYSPRYMLIEAACGLMILTLFRAVVLPLDPETFSVGLALWGWLQIFIYGLVAIAFIDLKYTYIPADLSIPLLIAGITLPFFIPGVDGVHYVVGAVAGGGFILAVYVIGWLIFRREAMGLGDAMLLAVIGAFLGWKALPFVVWAAAMQGLVAAGIAKLYTVITHKENGLTMTTEEMDAQFGEEDRFEGLKSRMAIPFGPFLALAAFEALFFGHDFFWRLSEQLTLLLMR